MTFLSLVSPIYSNVKRYGAIGDGITDDTTAITNAINDVNTAGGGTVFFPAGTYITGPQTLYPKVRYEGSGIEASIIKLKNGANADLLSAQTGSINVGAASGTGSAGTLYNFTLSNMTLDGNKANQSSGTSYPLRFYGYGFIFDNLRVLTLWEARQVGIWMR